MRCTPCARPYRFDLNGLGWNRDWIVERLMDSPPATVVA